MGDECNFDSPLRIVPRYIDEPINCPKLPKFDINGSVEVRVTLGEGTGYMLVAKSGPITKGQIADAIGQLASVLRY